MHLRHSETLSSGAASGRTTTGGRRAVRIGLGGPVGSGKTATVAALCHAAA